jgi:nucleic acid/nucleotide deaminase of polymorphic system toxin
VALNRMRILSRLRSKHTTHWRVKDKPSLLQRLQTAKSLLLDSSTSNPNTQSLVDDVENLQVQFDNLEAMDSTNARSDRSDVHLLGLIRSIHSILLLYEQDLERVPYTPSCWTGNATESIIDRLRKISQYVRAGDELLRAARRYTIFSSIAVEFVNLQQASTPLSNGAASMIQKAIETSCNRDTLSRVSSFRKTNINRTKKSIEHRLREIKTKLHAEIQLILHSGWNAARLRPRVICSSKSACYLCQLFIKLHGYHYIPTSHGRLYDTWKWPMPAQRLGESDRGGDSINLHSLLPQFTKAIDDKLNESLSNASLVRRLQPPLESTVDLLAAMTPSVLSNVSHLSVHTSMTHTAGSGGVSDVIPEHSQESDDTSSITSTETVRGPATLPQTTSSTTDLPEDVSPGSYETPKEPLCLRTGEIATHSFSVENSFLRIHVPGLHLRFEYDVSPTQGIQLGKKARQAVGNLLKLEMECLSDSFQASEASQAEAVDLEDGYWSEKSGLEEALFSEFGLLLKRRSTLLRLRARVSEDFNKE